MSDWNDEVIIARVNEIAATLMALGVHAMQRGDSAWLERHRWWGGCLQPAVRRQAGYGARRVRRGDDLRHRQNVQAVNTSQGARGDGQPAWLLVHHQIDREVDRPLQAVGVERQRFF